MLELHLVSLFSSQYIILASLQQIQWQTKPMELYCIAALESTVQGPTNTGPSSTASLVSVNACRGEIFLSPQLSMQKWIT